MRGIATFARGGFTYFDKWEKGRIEVRAQADKSKAAEIVIIGPIGYSLWDGSGKTEKEFRDALAKIPEDQEVIVGINSEGGSVQDGLGIYNAIAARRGTVTCRIDGCAYSIASVIPLAAKRVITPKPSIWMIHDPWAIVSGNRDDLLSAAEMLEANAGAIVAAYATKTGKPTSEIRAAMKATTWFSGEQALAWGLADELTDSPTDDAIAALNLDPTGIRNAPERVIQIWNSRRRTEEPTNTENIVMKKKEILALLARHGVNLGDTATDDQIRSELKKLVDARKVAESEARLLTDPPSPSPDTPTATVATDNSSASATAVQVEALQRSILALTQNAERLQQERDAERRRSAERVVDDCIAEMRIPAISRAAWVDRVVAGGDAVVAEIQSYPPRPLGGEAVAHIDVTNSAPEDIVKGLAKLRDSFRSLERGNSVTPEALHGAASEMGRIINSQHERLVQVFNATTIHADLKRIFLFQTVMGDFTRRILPLRVFSTVFANVPLEGTDEVAVPYYPLYTSASKTFVDADGYVFDKNRTVDSRKVTVDQREYQPFAYTSRDMARQPFFDSVRLFRQGVEQLAVETYQAVLGVVTAANYPAVAKAEPAATFDVDDIIDIGGLCDNADWPDVGRAIIFDTAYKTNLLKSPDLKHVDKSGTDAALRRGSLGVINNFDIYANNRIPTNAENLKGIVSFPSAILVATAPIMPGQGVRRQLVSYDVIVDPATGIAFEYRHWGDANKDEEREVVEVNYGFAKGQAEAIMRITSA